MHLSCYRSARYKLRHNGLAEPTSNLGRQNLFRATWITHTLTRLTKSFGLLLHSSSQNGDRMGPEWGLNGAHKLCQWCQIVIAAFDTCETNRTLYIINVWAQELAKSSRLADGITIASSSQRSGGERGETRSSWISWVLRMPGKVSCRLLHMLIQAQKTVQFVCACVPEKYDERKGKLFIHSHTHTRVHSHTATHYAHSATMANKTQKKQETTFV